MVKGISLRLAAGSAFLLLLTVAPAMAGGSISGKATAPSGLSTEGGFVNAQNEKFQCFRETLEADGAFSIDDLAPGTYTLVAVGKNLEPAVFPNLVVKEGQTLTQNVTFEVAKPFPIVRAAAPIPLTDDYNSTSFADAPEIHIDQAYQIRDGPLDDWRGPAELSGKFRIKFSDQALHLAGDMNFKIAGINNRVRADWDGNAIQFCWQNDPLDLTREEYNDDHNWQWLIALTEPVHWQLHQPSTGIQDIQSFAAANILRKERANKDGELVRIDFPWSLFPKTTSGTRGIPPPKVGDFAAMNIDIEAADFEMARSEAALRTGLGWAGGGLSGGDWNHPSTLRPIQFVEKAP